MNFTSNCVWNSLNFAISYGGFLVTTFRNRWSFVPNILHIVNRDSIVGVVTSLHVGHLRDRGSIPE